MLQQVGPLGLAAKPAIPRALDISRSELILGLG